MMLDFFRRLFSRSPSLPVKCMGESILCAYRINQETIDEGLDRPWCKVAVGDSVVEGKQHAQAFLPTTGQWYRLKGSPGGGLRVVEADMDREFKTIKVTHEIRPWPYWKESK